MKMRRPLLLSLLLLPIVSILCLHYYYFQNFYYDPYDRLIGGARRLWLTARKRAASIDLLSVKSDFPYGDDYEDYTGEDRGGNNWTIGLKDGTTKRANAVIVMLARNSDLDDAVQSLTDFEATFNGKYHYPYVFLNDEPFSDKFKATVTSLLNNETTTTRSVSFGLIPKEHWSYPELIDTEKSAARRKEMAEQGVLYGGSESYRHMCRYFSGFFFRHALIKPYDYYWRVEPGVRFYCQIDYDPFVYMIENKKEYGFIQVSPEGGATVATLWQTTVNFLTDVYPKLEHLRQLPTNSPAMRLVMYGSTQEKRDEFVKRLLIDHIDPSNDHEFQMLVIWSACHYWSNFEIAHLGFFRSALYRSYFNYLDQAGGFFYERWGDAPVHSLALAMFLETSQIHHFTDIGYMHGAMSWCPVIIDDYSSTGNKSSQQQQSSKCSCDVNYKANMALFRDNQTCIGIHTDRLKYFNSKAGKGLNYLGENHEQIN